MQIITLDFETYYDKDYSLSKITNEEYVRDARFQIIGVGVKVDDAPAEWFSGTHREIKVFLSQFDWANAMMLARRFSSGSHFSRASSSHHTATPGKHGDRTTSTRWQSSSRYMSFRVMPRSWSYPICTGHPGVVMAVGIL